MDKSVSHSRLAVHIEGVFPRGDGHGEVQKVNLGSSYLSREFHGRVKRINELEEFINRVACGIPHTHRMSSTYLRQKARCGRRWWPDSKISPF